MSIGTMNNDPTADIGNLDYMSYPELRVASCESLRPADIHGGGWLHPKDTKGKRTLV